MASLQVLLVSDHVRNLVFKLPVDPLHVVLEL